jgi:hypothetical protein
MVFSNLFVYMDIMCLCTFVAHTIQGYNDNVVEFIQGYNFWFQKQA